MRVYVSVCVEVRELPYSIWISVVELRLSGLWATLFLLWDIWMNHSLASDSYWVPRFHGSLDLSQSINRALLADIFTGIVFCSFTYSTRPEILCMLSAFFEEQDVWNGQREWAYHSLTWHLLFPTKILNLFSHSVFCTLDSLARHTCYLLSFQSVDFYIEKTLTSL